MKHFFFMCLSALIFNSAMAQDNPLDDSKFKSALDKGIEKLHNCKSSNDYIETANLFQRIAELKSDFWVPHYYSAFSTIMAAFTTPDKTKVDAMLEAVGENIGRVTGASDQQEVVSEGYVLLAMLESAKIAVDPQSRGAINGQASAMYVERSLALNPQNPRAAYIKAQNLYYTPEAFGGNKAFALEYLQGSWNNYENQWADVDEAYQKYYPSWGEKQAREFAKKIEAELNK